MPYRLFEAYHASFRIFQIALDALSELSLLLVSAMALFRDLISTIARAEGLSEMTVTGIGQYLRDAGLISKHGRGRAAAQMTTVDAANLLIGVNASDLAKNAVATVGVYSDLEVVRPEPVKIGDWSISPIFNDGVTLRQAVVTAIDAFIPDEYGLTAFGRDAGPGNYKLEIGFGGPIASAFVKVDEMGPPSPNNPFDGVKYKQAAAFAHFWDSRHLWSSSTGRRDLTIIDHVTLSAVGLALSK